MDGDAFFVEGGDEYLTVAVQDSEGFAVRIGDGDGALLDEGHTFAGAQLLPLALSALGVDAPGAGGTPPVSLDCTDYALPWRAVQRWFSDAILGFLPSL